MDKKKPAPKRGQAKPQHKGAHAAPPKKNEANEKQPVLKKLLFGEEKPDLPEETAPEDGDDKD